MKKILLSILIIALFIFAVLFVYFFRNPFTSNNLQIENALVKKDCPSTSPAPNFGNSYKGTLIDTHIHIPHVPEGPSKFLEERSALGGNITLGNYFCTFSAEGTPKVFAFFPVFIGFEEVHLGIVRGALQKYPGLFVPFIMPPDSDDKIDGFPTVSAEVLQKMLSIFPDIFKGYGEIGLYARGDHGGPKGSLALPPDSERLRKIYPIIRENKLLVYFHLGEGQQESFEDTLAENRDINFIFHGDQLIVYENGGQNLKAIDEILTRNPNAYYGIDELYGDTWLLRPEVKKEEFLAHFDDYEQLLKQDVATWKAFIERHPDQVLWGTDRGVGAPWSMDLDVGLVLTGYARAFIARLDKNVQEKFAYKNAEKLLMKNTSER